VPDDLELSLATRLDPKTAKAIGTHLGLHTVGDLVQHFPRRCAARGELTKLSALRVGEHVTIVGEVHKINKRSMKYRKGTLLEVVITDGVEDLLLTFFSMKGPQARLREGQHALFAGKVTKYGKRFQLTHPDCEPLGDEGDRDIAQAYADAPIPVYAATHAVPSWKIGKSVRTVLDTLGDVPDPVPADIRRRHGLPTRREAIERIHRPRTMDEWLRAQRRVRWDEAFVLQAELARRRAETRALPAVARTGVAAGLAAHLDQRLPFELTDGQRSVGARIATDLASSHPMNRLLQGEVGTGKTVVALRAMLTVVDSGGQAALLAPTEVLAQQHFRSITATLGPLAAAGQLGAADVATRVVLLTGSMPTARRRAALLAVQTGEAGIVVGTHALLQEHVSFFDLGLVVVDEQHRFGVEQRDLLRAKARADRAPHVLVMTATPIPRTIAMTVFGDLDKSTLTDQPLGRAGVTTHVVPADNERFMARTWERVREEVAAGHQAFVVCPQISSEDSDRDEDIPVDPIDDVADDEAGDESPRSRPPAAVLDLLPELQTGGLSGLRVAALHGRMTPEQKDETMQRFADRELDALVATTVVEVGVDVPNATAMVIMDAQRFGISQLHQLRGRVGRGTAPGVCLLVSSAEPDTPASRRVLAVAATNDGFKLAEDDLNLRREGDVLGRSQSGWRSSLRNLRVLRDVKIITEARDEALRLIDEDPTLAESPDLAAALAALAERDRAEFLERG